MFSWVAQSPSHTIERSDVPAVPMPSLLGLGLVPQASSWGWILLLLALGFDGVTGHVEDLVIKDMEWKHGRLETGEFEPPALVEHPGQSRQSAAVQAQAGSVGRV